MIYSKSMLVDGVPSELLCGFRIADLMKPGADGLLKKESVTFEVVQLTIGDFIYVCKSCKVIVKNNKLVTCLDKVYDMHSISAMQAEQAADRVISESKSYYGL